MKLLDNYVKLTNLFSVGLTFSDTPRKILLTGKGFDLNISFEIFDFFFQFLWRREVTVDTLNPFVYYLRSITSENFKSLYITLFKNIRGQNLFWKNGNCFLFTTGTKPNILRSAHAYMRTSLLVVSETEKSFLFKSSLTLFWKPQVRPD